MFTGYFAHIFPSTHRGKSHQPNENAAMSFNLVRSISFGLVAGIGKQKRTITLD
jgi:hypothetical protein